MWDHLLDVFACMYSSLQGPWCFFKPKRGCLPFSKLKLVWNSDHCFFLDTFGMWWYLKANFQGVVRGSSLATESRVFFWGGGHQEPAHNSFRMVIYISISPKNKGGGGFKHLFVSIGRRAHLPQIFFRWASPKKVKNSRCLVEILILHNCGYKTKQRISRVFCSFFPCISIMCFESWRPFSTSNI